MVAASRGALEIKRDLMHFYRLIIGVLCCGDEGTTGRERRVKENWGEGLVVLGLRGCRERE